MREHDHLYDARLSYIEQALDIDPACQPAIKERAALMNYDDRMAAALHDAGAAIALDPNDPEPRLQDAVFRLKMGDYAEGWRRYEQRWKHPTQERFIRRYGRHRYTGREPIAGKSILVWPEQGFGDMIQFARYAPLLAGRGARVLVQVPPELALLFTTLRDCEIVTTKTPSAVFDYQIPMLSLPAAFGTTLDTVPADVPYLSAVPDYGSSWRAAVEPLPRPRVGFAWTGLTNKIPLAHFEPIYSTSGISLVSLQHDAPLADVAMPGVSGWCRAQHFGNFADTAAMIAACDLVISIDTATAHLAGAMGKPVWLMLPVGCEWRWLTKRADSPWYPTMRVFRQQQRGDWRGLAERVAAEFTQRIAHAPA